jgi:excinuclease UvrABC ATPase subunit
LTPAGVLPIAAIPGHVVLACRPKTADWVIDLGPDGGRDGGTVMAAGTPETVAAVPHSHTAHFLRTVLKG